MRGRRRPSRAGCRGRPECRASSRRRSSIAKHRGAEMSSRLIPPKPGAMAPNRRDDLVLILRREADRPRIDSAEFLEEDGLALHHGQRGFRADVAEPEHRRAVGDDGDCVLLDRQVPDQLRVVGDRHARHGRRPGCRPSTGRRGSSTAPLPRPRSCLPNASGTSGPKRARPRLLGTILAAATMRSM